MLVKIGGGFWLLLVCCYQCNIFFTFAGQSYVKRFCGGFGIESKKGRSQFAVTNVATEINSVEQVGFSVLFSLIMFNHSIFRFIFS